MKISQRTKIAGLLLGLLGVGGSVHAASYTFEDIRIEGLQRISAGTVFNYLPIKPGDSLDDSQTPELIRALYKTGFFKDVRLEKEGGVLNIVVTERPSIDKINLEGNKSIKEEDLRKGLTEIGLAEGRTFNRSVLNKIEQELRRQFYNQGKYAVELTTEVTPLERNRVAIDINIVEGKTAKIKKVNIVGNRNFDDDLLMKDFQSRVGGWFSFLSKEDQYSRPKLAGDLEVLRSFYLDRGYINFAIDSTQVAISPDKKDIYITINVSEGSVYTISDIKLAGDLVVVAEDLFPLISLRRGESFSRRNVVDSTDRLNSRLSDSGYAFANVNHIPEVDEENKTVSITYFVDPGKRVYVNRLNITGNTRSRDRVIRREFRQMEKAWLSSDKIKLSKQRLRRLGFFEDVSLETPAVPGTTDQVNVDVKVKEKPSGAFTGGLGYSKDNGVALSSSIREDNFLGTGKRVALAFNTSSYNTLYELSYFNPYSTIDGISRGFSLSYRETDFEELNVADYGTNVGKISVDYGIPLSEFNRFNVGLALENIDFLLGAAPSQEIREFVEEEGDSYLNFKLTASWKHDSRNNAIFPTRGTLQRFEAEATVPFSDLEYYKASYYYRQYIPIFRAFTLSARGEIGFGDGYGGSDTLPFFENFFGGGERSVRGFESNSLGPRDSNDDPLGGNIKLVGSLELIAPPPLEDFRDTLRMMGFFDIGQVYQDELKFDELRYSVGFGVTWLSPVGAMTLSYGIPLNDKDGDEIEEFQFSFGQNF
ncbi:MAG: outer membrane protein assembly factor BamA [bacterium]